MLYAMTIIIIVLAVFFENYLFTAAIEGKSVGVQEDCPNYIPLREDGTVDYDEWTTPVIEEFWINNREYSEINDASKELLEEVFQSLQEADIPEEEIVSDLEPTFESFNMTIEPEVEEMDAKVQIEKCKVISDKMPLKEPIIKRNLENKEAMEAYKERLRRKISHIAYDNAYDANYLLSLHELYGLEGRYEEQLHIEQEYFDVYGEPLAC